MKQTLLGLMAGVAVFAALPAQAATLLPGTTGQLFTPFVAATQGGLLTTTTVPGIALTFSATMRSAVYRNTLGTLDFYYQVARTGPGTDESDEIAAFTASNFAGFMVDAFVSGTDPDAGGFFTASTNGISTTTLGRSMDGKTLRTDFNLNGLVNTETSATYIFRTNATAYRGGTFGVIDGSTFSGRAFQPTVSAAVPEPATWGMMLVGFGVVGSALRRRKSKLAYAI